MPGLVNGFDPSIRDEKASKVGPAGIDIAYQQFGSRDASVALLIMGIAAQFISWPDAFCHALVDRDLQVIRFDNRDVGLSTHLTDAPPPNLPAALAGDLSSVSYTLSDMAADAVGLLDALGFDKAHVVGASLGGAIAQTMAIEHPHRVRSLTSMMSSTGNKSVGQPSPDALREMFGGPPAVTREDAIQQTLRAFRAVGSPGYPMDEKEVAERAGRAYDRSYDPIGRRSSGHRFGCLRRSDPAPAASSDAHSRDPRPRGPQVRRQRRARHSGSHSRRRTRPHRRHGAQPATRIALPTRRTHRRFRLARGTPLSEQSILSSD
jgi:pimeloyl-ACP methyl ester carboxylesterase